MCAITPVASRNTANSAGVSLTAAAMPIPAPAQRCPGPRARSHSTSTASSRLICPYRSVVHTGSHHTAAAETHQRVSTRAWPTMRRVSHTNSTRSARFPAVARVRRSAGSSTVSGVNSSAAKGGYVAGNRAEVVRSV
ncbi:hypothetical protein Save01_05237 [Streptomyces avermitilis]